MITVAVIDFETTGMIPGPDRIIEIGAVIVRDGLVVDTFSTLMDPGFHIPGFITGLTGITTAMVRGKPRPETVMPQLRDFLGDLPCLAHNASFDRRFFVAEMARAGHDHERPFLCSVMLARRLVVGAPSHRLGALVEHLGLEVPPGHQAHRALGDAVMTAQLWARLLATVRQHLGGEPNVGLLQALMRVPRTQVPAWLSAQAERRV